MLFLDVLRSFFPQETTPPGLGRSRLCCLSMSSRCCLERLCRRDELEETWLSLIGLLSGCSLIGMLRFSFLVGLVLIRSFCASLPIFCCLCELLVFWYLLFMTEGWSSLDSLFSGLKRGRKGTRGLCLETPWITRGEQLGSLFPFEDRVPPSGA